MAILNMFNPEKDRRTGVAIGHFVHNDKLYEVALTIQEFEKDDWV